jgi:hypothetical protein
MYRYVLVVLLSLVSSIAFAGPDLIDIIGLVPGKSTWDEVKAAARDGNDRRSGVTLEIGGHVLPCDIDFIEERLAEIFCFTGKESTKASNVVIHDDFVRGFSKKFGKPDTNVSPSIRTKAGVDYSDNKVEWIDKKGNTLTLRLYMMNRIDKGGMQIRSAEFIKKEQEAAVVKQNSKKF